MTEPVISARVHDAAAAWLARHDIGLTAQTKREFDAWIAADPAHRRAFDAAARDWSDSVLLARSAVGRTRKLGRAPFLMRHSTHVGAAGLGLAALVGLVTVGVVRGDSPFALVAPVEAAVYQTSVGEIRTIKLADGSRVTLDTASRLRVAFPPGERRLALEDGRARFRVAPDRKRLFIVRVPGGAVVARGTLFDIALSGRVAKVATIEGVVLLRPDGAPAASQSLAAGQMVLFGTGATPRSLAPGELRWTTGMLALEATPLGTAVAAINRYNALPVRLADPQLATLPVTGAFRARDPEGFARAVAATFGLRVLRSDALTLAPRPSDTTPEK